MQYQPITLIPVPEHVQRISSKPGDTGGHPYRRTSPTSKVEVDSVVTLVVVVTVTENV